MDILKIVCAIACLALHASALISSEEKNDSSNALFSVIAMQNEHYAKFENLAKNAAITITSSSKGQLQGTLILDEDSSKTFLLSTDTINNLLLEWNYASNSKHNVSLWRLLHPGKDLDLTVRLNSPSPEELTKLNNIQHAMLYRTINNTKQIFIKTPNPNTRLVFSPKQPIITQKYFSVPATLCRFCDTSE